MSKTLEEILKSRLTILEKLEQLLLGKKGFVIKENVTSNTLSNPKNNLLALIHSLRGSIHMSLNFPDITGRKTLQEKLKKLTDGLDSLLIEQLTTSSTSRTFKGISITYKLENTGTRQTKTAQITINQQEFLSLMFNILGIHGLVEELLLPHNSDVLAQIESYKKVLENKLKELQETKRKMEEFIKENSLEVFSKNFLKQASELQKQAKRSAIVTTFLYIIVLLFLFFILSNPSSGLQSVMARFTIVFLIAGIATYLLKYTIRLFERKNEYENKALVLSTFPALNYFLGNDEHKFELIRTLILENQKLQTLQSTKDSSINEDLIIKLFSILKDIKPGSK